MLLGRTEFPCSKVSFRRQESPVAHFCHGAKLGRHAGEPMNAVSNESKTSQPVIHIILHIEQPRSEELREL